MELPFKIDRIENPDYLKNPLRFIDQDFPKEMFIEYGFTDKQIIGIVKLTVTSLQCNAINSQLIDIKKYQFNQYSKNEFINQEFYDLLASIFDYLKHHDNANVNPYNANGKIIVTGAIEATLNAAAVLMIKNNPILLKLLNKDQQNDLKIKNNQTVRNIQMLDNKRAVTNSSSKEKVMNPMMKMLMMKQMMGGQGGSSSFNPMLLMAIKQNGGDSDSIQKMMLMQSLNNIENPMVKMIMMKKMMEKSSKPSTSPVELSPQMQKQKQMMDMMKMMNGGGMNSNNPMMKMMAMKQMMNGGGSNNAMALMNGAGNMSQMDKLQMMQRLMNGDSGTSGNMTNAMRQQALQQKLMADHKQKQMEAMMSFMNKKNQEANANVSPLQANPPNPELAEEYSNADVDINKPHLDPHLEQLRQGIVDADKNNEQMEALIAGFGGEFDDIDEEEEQHVDVKDDMDDPSFVGWLEDREEDDDLEDEKREEMSERNEFQATIPPFYDDFNESEMGIVDKDEMDFIEQQHSQLDYVENNPHLFESNQTLVSEGDMIDPEVLENSIESEPELTGHEKWIKSMMEDQELVIEKFFNGVVPEGVERIETDGVNYYAFTPETLFSGNYTTRDTLDYYFKQGITPPAEAAAYPLSFKGKNRVVSILSSDGVRGDILIPVDKEDEMELNEHIPPKAIVEWQKLRKEAIFDSDNNIIESSVVTTDSELVGSINSASITANCLAIATKETDLENTKGMAIEYQLTDPAGFYVEDSKEILEAFGQEVEIESIDSLIETLKDFQPEYPAVVKHMDRTATEMVNDFLHYSMAIDLTIDSFTEDYHELVKVTEAHENVQYAKFLKGFEKTLINGICSAVRGDTVEGLSEVGGEYKTSIEVDGETLEEIETFNGSDHDESLILFNNKVQVTEVPWTIDEIALNFTKALPNAKPFVSIRDIEEYEDIYPAIREIFERATIDDSSRTVVLMTKDRTKLVIKPSAYSNDAYVLIKSN